MTTLPLIAHRRLDAVIAWCGSTPVSVRQFLGEVEHVAGQLPPGQHVLNLCGDRYRFAVALAACIVSGRISLLPSTHTPEMVRQMQRIAPDVFCIVDQCVIDKDGAGVDLRNFRYPESMPPPAARPGCSQYRLRADHCPGLHLRLHRHAGAPCQALGQLGAQRAG